MSDSRTATTAIDVVDQRRHVPFLEAILGQIPFQSDALTEGRSHDCVSFCGIREP